VNSATAQPLAAAAAAAAVEECSGSQSQVLRQHRQEGSRWLIYNLVLSL
jgi:hypothetical protein